MLIDERQAILVARIDLSGRVLAAEAAAEFGTSEDTIRRDLRELAARGLCRRVYGGAVRLSPASGTAAVRSGQDGPRKDRLGAALARLVTPGQFVFFDVGTTNLAAARALPRGLKATVATHDPAIAAALATRDDLDLIVVGGRVDPVARAALGVEAARSVSRLRPDLLILGACALDADEGVAAFGLEDAEMKRLLVQRSGGVAVAMLSEKLGTWAPFSIGPASLVGDLVVEPDAPAAVVDALAARGIRLHRCGAAPSGPETGPPA